MALHRRLRLPESSHRALRTLIGLSSEQVERLEQAIRQSKPTLSPHELAESVASHLGKEADELDVAHVIYTLGGLYVARAASGYSLSDFIEQVREAMEASDDKALQPKDDNWTGFKERLARLLDIDQPLGTTAKAADVMTEHEHTFCSARVMTDMRPIFKSDPTARPEAVVIIHMLKLIYHDGHETRQLFLALDNEDVSELKELLARAEQKGEALIPVTRAAGLELLDVERV